MCLLLFSYRRNQDLPFVLAANRDEAYARPSDPLDYWEDAPDVLAGRDREAGGTWMGVTRTGRFAALTNFREHHPGFIAARSRGLIVADFLRSDTPPASFLEALYAKADDYAGFNLLVGDLDGLWYYSNRGRPPAPVTTGVHGLSNRFLDTPWPKVTGGLAAFEALLAGGETTAQPFFDVLRDETPAPDEALPDTGVGLAWERRLSPRFIRTPNYGTRVSSFLRIDRAGNVLFEERTHAPDGTVHGTRTFRFQIVSHSPV